MAQKSTKIVKTTSIRGLDPSYIPSAGQGIDKINFTDQTKTNIETLYKTVKASPEITACFNAIVEDIMADEWDFIGSETAKKDVLKFQIRSNLYKILTNALLDLLITGNAYILKLSVDEEKVSSLFKVMTKELGKKLGVKFDRREKAQVFELINQEFKKPKDLQNLQASTIKINYDETGKILSYEQNVRGEKRIYRTKDIIHLSLMNVGGQVYGFTPLEPLLKDVARLMFAKNYVGKYFENDGIPDFLFKLPDASPDDRNYELLKKELKDLRNKSHKYRSMVLTGNIEVDQIKKMDKDMEFKSFIEHFTQIILMALGVPAHRLGYTLFIKDTAQTVGKMETGYYKKIAFIQKILENSLNKHLFDAFNIAIKFKRSYKLDEMREAQIVQILTQANLITVQEARKLMGLEPKIPKGDMPKPTGDDIGINFREDKKREQGIEEKPKDNTDNKLKTLFKSIENALEISFMRFRTIVEGKLGEGNFNNGNILYLETAEEYVLFFNDGQWEYKTRVPKSQEFFEENLLYATRIRI